MGSPFRCFFWGEGMVVLFDEQTNRQLDKQKTFEPERPKEVAISLVRAFPFVSFVSFVSQCPLYLARLRLGNSIYSVYTNSVLGLEVHTSWRIAFVP